MHQRQGNVQKRTDSPNLGADNSQFAGFYPSSGSQKGKLEQRLDNGLGLLKSQLVAMGLDDFATAVDKHGVG